jgi:AraC family ethanolamine operon transcriptional activator
VVDGNVVRVLTRLRGISPAGMLGFCLPIRSVDRGCYWGKAPRPGVTPAMLPGGLDVLMDAGQTHVVVLISLDMLRRSLPEDGFDALTRGAANRELPMSPADDQQLTAWLLGIIASARQSTRAEDASALARLLEEELPWRLSHACLRALDSPARPDRSARRLALDRAIGFLRDADAGSVTVGDLCRIAGVKQRTLEYGFKEGLGLSPLRFVRLLRLHAARRALAASEPGEATVGDIAMRSGLLHQSRFAAEYGALFGEMP